MNSALLVSRETEERLSTLCRMVERWNRTINIVSISTLRELKERHIDDSTQLLYGLDFNCKRWLDVGSGGGFPGLVIAAHLCDLAPACMVVLVESDQRKAVFLREAVRAMNLSSLVHADRVENLPDQQADIVSARALAPLPKLFSWCARHLNPNGICIFPKGKTAETELSDARTAGWTFDATQRPSITDPASTVLTIRNLSRDKAL
jgi:16S rRNA (guanine527-N7)-methyltransferase